MSAAPRTRTKRPDRKITERFPTGSLVKLVGDSWLDKVTGQISLVTGHGHDRFGSYCIFLQLSEQTLDVPYALMSPNDLELIE